MEYKVTDEVMSVVPIDEILDTWESGDAEMMGMTLPQMLDHKRGDDHYPKLVETLKTEGWTKGVGCVSWINGVKVLSDGHHRLAAAIDLGQKYVPVRSGLAEADSGSWGQVKTAQSWL